MYRRLKMAHLRPIDDFAEAFISVEDLLKVSVFFSHSLEQEEGLLVL